MTNSTQARKMRRKMRVSSNMFGTAERPRISIHRSNKYIYAQAIDDESRKTLASYSSLQLDEKTKKENKKSDEAKSVGANLAKALLDKKIKSGIFDRGRFAYNGRVKALAEGLREGGLTI